ncbi:caspase family protein [Chitinophaga sp. MM2321]|uniref:caspase family protein n=1 Tax=Chitinophaga sp. MM2321 TaxID=3137178 RepID=UPI0032D59D9C
MSTNNQVSSDKMAAILIGVKDYDGPDNLHPLYSAENNANSFYKMLRSRKYDVDGTGTKLGVPDARIFKKTDGAVDANALRADILNFLEKIFTTPDNGSPVSSPDLVLFYYAGHGYYDLREKKYYLTVKHTRLADLKGTAIDMEDLCELLTRFKKKVVMIIDACFSENTFDYIQSRSDFYIIASSAYNKTSKYPEDAECSVFTTTFLKWITNGIIEANGALSFKDIFDASRDELEKAEQPVPTCLEKNDTGSIILEVNNYKQPVAQPTNDVDQEPDFDVESYFEDAMRRIFSIFMPGGTIGRNFHDTVFNSFPITIAVFLRNMFVKKTLLKDVDFLLNYYYQIIRFLAFIIIKENDQTHITTRENGKIIVVNKENEQTHFLSDEDRKILGRWREPGADNSVFIEIVRYACIRGQGEFTKQLAGNMTFLNRINKIEELIASNLSVNHAGFVRFRDLLFYLLSDMRFFREYNLWTVRFVEIKKSIMGTVIYKHQVSQLYGPDPSSYSSENLLESNIGSLHNAIILIPKKPLDKEIVERNFITLWPFLIDGNSNNETASLPDVCVLSKIVNDFGERQFNYKRISLIKERNGPTVEYSSLTSFPEKKEWEEFFGAGIIQK